MNNNDIIIKIYKRSLITSFLIMGISFIAFNDPKPIVLGYLFGLIISMLSFKLLDNTINRAVRMTPGKSKGYTMLHYIFRYVLYFIVLIVAGLAPYLNLPAAILGLLIIKFTIIVSTILDKEFTKRV